MRPKSFRCCRQSKHDPHFARCRDMDAANFSRAQPAAQRPVCLRAIHRDRRRWNIAYLARWRCLDQTHDRHPDPTPRRRGIWQRYLLCRWRGSLSLCRFCKPHFARRHYVVEAIHRFHLSQRCDFRKRCICRIGILRRNRRIDERH